MSATNVARVGKRGNICVGNNVSATMCPRLPVALEPFFVSRTQNLCPQQMLRARANWETFVSATMCPQQCVDAHADVSGLFSPDRA